jgi:hypothetical protein
MFLFGALSFEAKSRARIANDLPAFDCLLQDKAKQLDLEKSSIPFHLVKAVVRFNPPVRVLLGQALCNLAGRGNAHLREEDGQCCPCIGVSLVSLWLSRFIAVFQKAGHPIRKRLASSASTEVWLGGTLDMGLSGRRSFASGGISSDSSARIFPVPVHVAGLNPEVGATLSGKDGCHVYHSVPKIGSNKILFGAFGSRGFQ